MLCYPPLGVGSTLTMILEQGKNKNVNIYSLWDIKF